MEDVFSDIYIRHGWMIENNPESPRSGPGSTLEHTESLRKAFPEILDIFNVRTLFDAPCGDMTWMSYLLKDLDITYIGGDIVKPMIKENIMLYGDSRTFFCHIDITKDRLPNADMMLCRDCLFHLSYSDIRKALINFYESGIKYILTTTHIHDEENIDIESGGFRSLNLMEYPFNFPRPLYVVEEPSHLPGIPRQINVWSREQIGESNIWL